MSDLSDFIKQVQQEVSTYPAWQRNLLRDSLIPFNEDKKPMSDENMRANFESWARRHGYNTRRADYADSDTEHAWKAYVVGRREEQKEMLNLAAARLSEKLLEQKDDATNERANAGGV